MIRAAPTQHVRENSKALRRSPSAHSPACNDCITIASFQNGGRRLISRTRRHVAGVARTKPLNRLPRISLRCPNVLKQTASARAASCSQPTGPRDIIPRNVGSKLVTRSPRCIEFDEHLSGGTINHCDATLCPHRVREALQRLSDPDHRRTDGAGHIQCRFWSRASSGNTAREAGRCAPQSEARRETRPTVFHQYQ